MTTRKVKALKALALFVVFCFAQVYVQAGLGDPGTSVPQGPRVITARLVARGGATVLVNGNSSANGATILTGATIDVPDQVSAAIDLGPLGTLDISPGTRLQLDYDSNGARIKLFKGCVVFKAKGNATGEVYTDQGASEKTDKNRHSLGFCFVNGALTPNTAPAAVGAGLTSAEKLAIIFGIGGTTGILVYAFSGRGTNPSPAR
jgi:hypothetical protein